MAELLTNPHSRPTSPLNFYEVSSLPASFAASVTRDGMGAVDLTSPSFAYDKNGAALDLDIDLKNPGPSRGFGAGEALALDSAPSAELPHPLPTSPTYSLSSRGTEVMPELDDEPEAHSAGGGKSARHDSCAGLGGPAWHQGPRRQVSSRWPLYITGQVMQELGVPLTH